MEVSSPNNGPNRSDTRATLEHRRSGESPLRCRPRRRSTTLDGMFIGSHVSSDDPLGTAVAEGADCVQLFLGDPQGWKKPPPREDAEQLRSSPIPVYVHAPYIVNL